MARIYFPEGPPRGVPGEVDLSTHALLASHEHQSWRIAWGDVTLRFGGLDDAFVIFEDPSQPGLEVWAEREIIKELRQLRDRLPRAANERVGAALGTSARRTSGRWIGGIVGVVGTVGVLVWLVAGGFVDLIVAVTPHSVDQALGDFVLDTLEVERCGDDALDAQAKGILDRLERKLQRSPFDFDLIIAVDPSVNAFALPGGHLVVHSGLLASSSSPDEVAAVLGHEMMHSLGRHQLKGLIHRVGLVVAVSAIVGDTTGLAALAANYGAELGALGFSRDQERAADKRGLKLMARAGYDPEAMATFFDRLAEDETEMSAAAAFFGTHPASAERSATVRQIASGLKRGGTAPQIEGWAQLKQRCGRHQD